MNDHLSQTMDSILHDGEYLPVECKRLQDFAGEIWELKQALNTINHKEMKYIQKINALTKKIQDSYEMNHHLQKEVSSLHSKNVDLEAICFDYRESMNKLKDLNMTWKGKLASLSSTINKQSTEVKRLESLNETLNEAMKKMTADMNSHKKSLQHQFQHKISSLEAKNKELTSTNDDLTKQLAEIAPKYHQLSSQHKDIMARMKEYRVFECELLLDKEGLKEQVAAQEKRIIDLENRNEMLEAVLFAEGLSIP